MSFSSNMERETVRRLQNSMGVNFEPYLGGLGIRPVSQSEEPDEDIGEDLFGNTSNEPGGIRELGFPRLRLW